MQQTKGIRLNNPGNIERGDPWQGLANAQRDERFCHFKHAKWGIRAIARILITYQDRRVAKDGTRIDAVDEFIERWAPQHENPTDNYIRFVADVVGVPAAAEGEIDVTDYKTMHAFVRGIIQFENGSQPYDDDVIDMGLRLAGIEVPAKPLSKSRTVVASTTAVAATATNALAEQVPVIKQALTPLTEAIPWVPVLLTTLTLFAIGVTIYARIDDQLKERRS